MTETELMVWAEAHASGPMVSAVAVAVLKLRDELKAFREEVRELKTKVPKPLKIQKPVRDRVLLPAVKTTDLPPERFPGLPPAITAEQNRFDGTYPLPPNRTAGYKEKPPPGSSGEI